MHSLNRSPLFWARLLITVLALLAAAAAQQPAAKSAEKPRPKAQQPAAPEKPKATEKKVSPAEAEALFRSVDEILKFASQDTGLPIRRPVKRELATRAQVAAFVRERLKEDENARQLQQSELVLKKFGLLPAGFDLGRFLVEVMEEQVAGYYDPRVQTMYLMDWVPADTQQMVLAHELTHALQDQNFELEKWLKAEPEDSAKPAAGAGEHSRDEEMAARQAVSEGQAMAVFLDYMLRSSGKTLVDVPWTVELFKRQTLEQTKASPVFGAAPMYLQEAITFSYTYGLDFVRKLLEAGGQQLAFDAALRYPPRNTRQIMEPKTYIDREELPAVTAPDLKRVLKDHHVYDSGEVGQFDVYVMLKQFRDEETADKLATKWRGGAYSVGWKADPKSKDATPPTGGVTLLYLSRWAAAEDATRFATEYAAWLPQRYSKVERVAGVKNKWMTNDGPLFIEPLGTSVLVMESFDEAAAEKIREAVVGKSPDPPKPAQ